MRLCEHCNKYFFDSGREEEAIVYYSGKYRFKGIVTLAFFAILCSFGGISLLKENLYVGLILIAISVFLIALIIKRIVKTTPENLQRNLERKENLNEGVAISLERLSNPDYLLALANHGVEVPDFFMIE